MKSIPVVILFLSYFVYHVCYLLLRKNSVDFRVNHFHKGTKRHVNSKRHLVAVVKEKTFGNCRIQHSLDNHLKLSHNQHNELLGKK